MEEQNKSQSIFRKSESSWHQKRSIRRNTRNAWSEKNTSRKGDVLQRKPLEMPMTECLPSIKLIEVHFQVINCFLGKKIQLSFTLFFIFGTSSACSRSSHHSDWKKSGSQTHCNEECHNIPSVYLDW